MYYNPIFILIFQYSFSVFIANLVVKITEIKNIKMDIIFFLHLTPSFTFSINSFIAQYGENFICTSFQPAFDQLTNILIKMYL